MTEIKVIPPPSAADAKSHIIRPEDANPDMANAAMLRRLLEKWPTPAISSKKFTVIHGLMISLNHKEGENHTYIDTSRLIALMNCVEYKSVNEDGFLPKSIFAYLMHPTYIIQGMPQLGQTEQKPGLLSSMWGKITGKGDKQTQQVKQ